MDINTNTVGGIIAASVPGILVALITQYLALIHEARTARRAVANALALLGLEMERNHDVLKEFWTGINALDTASSREETANHLAAMAAGGLLGQTLPHWSFLRWETATPEAIGALDKKDVEKIDQIYRNLRTVTDLFTQLVTLQPDERAQLEGTRFWANRYADMRSGTFDRLGQVVESVISTKSPFAGQ